MHKPPLGFAWLTHGFALQMHHEMRPKPSGFPMKKGISLLA
jgi:hypothetical protein